MKYQIHVEVCKDIETDNIDDAVKIADNYAKSLKFQLDLSAAPIVKKVHDASEWWIEENGRVIWKVYVGGEVEIPLAFRNALSFIRDNYTTADIETWNKELSSSIKFDGFTCCYIITFDSYSEFVAFTIKWS